jgi:hypothetical protein
MQDILFVVIGVLVYLAFVGLIPVLDRRTMDRRR